MNCAIGWNKFLSYLRSIYLIRAEYTAIVFADLRKYVVGFIRQRFIS